jgi:hypothetical protein
MFAERKLNQWPTFKAYFRRHDLVYDMAITDICILVVHYPTPFQRIYLVEINLCIIACISEHKEWFSWIPPFLAFHKKPPGTSCELSQPVRILRILLLET